VVAGADRSLKFVLSLGGGGYRGLFTIEFLTLLEAEVGPLKDRVSLIIGTSAGSINAMGLASGLAAKTIRDQFLKLGKSVFPPERIPLAGIIAQVASHKRDPAQLESALVEMLNDRTLGKTIVPALATAVDLTAGLPRVFKPKRLGGRDDELRLVDVVLASTAAPTYFPPHAIGPKLFVDGGLFANVPDLIAAVESTTSTGWNRDRIRLLCIGTTLESAAMAASAKTAALSGIDWGNPRTPLLLQQIMGSQIRSARDNAKKIVGEDHYIVVDPAPSSSQEAVLGLDVATEDAKKTLASMAHDAFRQFLEDHSTFVSLLKSAHY
jgi:patatin-like phospholipase/acyl hydrolase